MLASRGISAHDIIPSRPERMITSSNEVRRLYSIVVDTVQASLQSPVNEASFADIVPWVGALSSRTRIKVRSEFIHRTNWASETSNYSHKRASEYHKSFYIRNYRCYLYVYIHTADMAINR